MVSHPDHCPAPERRLVALTVVALALTAASPIQAADETATTASIDARTCRRLVRHIPDPDVTYRPGVDVRGTPVAPADLHDYSAFEALVPDTVTFHVVLDPFEYAGTAPRGIESPGMVLGTVSYDINRGTFAINGRPITTGEQDALVRACRLGLSGRVAPGVVIYPPGYDGPPLPDPKPVP
jgi:hypothetical protein